MNQVATDGTAPAQDESAFFTRVFVWMGVALAVTGAAAAAVGSSGTALHVAESKHGEVIFIILIVLEFALVTGLVGLVSTWASSRRPPRSSGMPCSTASHSR